MNNNDFNGECENCWCQECEINSIIGGSCENCEKCSADNADGRYKHLNNKWKMNCKNFAGKGQV